MLRRTVYAAMIVAALSCAALAADISGTWEFNVETSQGSGSPSFEFKQNGEKLTGTYSGMFGKRRSQVRLRATRLNSPSRSPMLTEKCATKARSMGQPA